MIEPAASETAAKSMDWLTFWSSVIGSVAWPLVAVLFILVFKRQLTGLAQRVTKMTLPGGADVTFSQGLEQASKQTDEVEAEVQAEVQAEALSEPRVDAKDDTPTQVETDHADEGAPQPGKESIIRTVDPADISYLWMAKHLPHAAVTEAYREVEQAMNQTRQRFSHAGKTERSTLLVLLSSGVLSPDMIELWERLRQLRNTALHSRETVITEAEALEYRVLCRRFLDALKKAMRVHGYRRRKAQF